MHKLFLVILLLFSSRYSVLSLKCYINPLPFSLNYSVTFDTLPSFSNNTLIDTSGECTFTIIWLRNPEDSMIIFGYNDVILNENSSSSDLILASVEYQLEGDEYVKRLSHDVQLKCRSSDGCNNGINLKQVLKSIKIEEDFSNHFNSLITSNSSFNNQSINNCYFNLNSTNQCSPIDYFNCRRCQISMNLTNSSINDICATCPTITNYYNSIIRDKIFIINNRSEQMDRVQLSCQIGEHCNSIENVYLIRQFSVIIFDFDKYFSSSSSTIFLSMKIQIIILFIGFIF